MIFCTDFLFFFSQWIVLVLKEHFVFTRFVWNIHNTELRKFSMSGLRRGNVSSFSFHNHSALYNISPVALGRSKSILTTPCCLLDELLLEDHYGFKSSVTNISGLWGYQFLQPKNCSKIDFNPFCYSIFLSTFYHLDEAWDQGTED